MSTFTININAVNNLLAKDKDYEIDTLLDPIYLYILIEDDLGKEPTEITNIDSTGFTIGTVVIDATAPMRVIFTPNGMLATQTFDYTITDDLSRTSTATVTITTL